MNCDYVRSIFEYDKETGLLSWKNRPIDHFKSKRVVQYGMQGTPGRMSLMLAKMGTLGFLLIIKDIWLIGLYGFTFMESFLIVT